MHSGESVGELLGVISEPTRLRILNSLAAAPLCVSDLQSILELPQPTISRHLMVLRKANLVRDTQVAQYVLYRLRRESGPHGRMLQVILEALSQDDVMRSERYRALDRNRSHTRTVMNSEGRI